MKAASVLFLTLLCAPASAQTVERISLSTGGSEGDGDSRVPSMSADGQLVAFESRATDLVSGDTNASRDIFLHDRVAGTTVRISVDSAGNEADDDSFSPAIAADGSAVAFFSSATNLVAGDSNGVRDVFVHEVATGLTTRVSVSGLGAEGDDDSYTPSISGDGRYVAFDSDAGNLVLGDANGVRDCFVHDRQTGTTFVGSVDSAGVAGNDRSFSPAISDDGSRIAFYSSATNLVASDTNSANDIFVHDFGTGVTVRASVSSAGVEATGGVSFWPDISPDGDVVAFYSGATNLVAGDLNGENDCFVHVLSTGETHRVSVRPDGGDPDGDSFYPVLSGDGRYVAFYSSATNLVASDTNSENDIFVHDRATGITRNLHVDASGVQGDDGAGFPDISPDGRRVVFNTDASNLLPGDGNGRDDVYLVTDCHVSFVEYGAGLAGSGGFVPSLRGQGGFCVPGGYSVEIADGLGGALSFLWIGTASGSVPFAGGTFLIDLGSANARSILALGGAAGVPGAGSLSLAGVDATAFSGLSIYLQSTILDPGAPRNLALSAGLEVQID